VVAQLSEESLVKANAQFWEQMLNMSLDRIPSNENFCVGKGHLRASVSLSGMWKGRIEVRFARGLAAAATAAMTMQPADAVSEADMLDAIREIANMIGGVLKSSLPRPCMMALPESGVAEEGLCVHPESGDALAVAFRHEAGGLMVRVWEDACGGA
jgi:chemotaxis protein CheX